MTLAIGAPSLLTCRREERRLAMTSLRCSGGATQGRARKIHRPGSALSSPAYCFASVIVWTENTNVTISDRFICFILTVSAAKKVVNFFEGKSASGWPGWRIFWPRNDLAPLLRWRRHCFAVGVASSAVTSSWKMEPAGGGRPEVAAMTWILESIIVDLQPLLLENTRSRCWSRFLHALVVTGVTSSSLSQVSDVAFLARSIEASWYTGHFREHSKYSTCRCMYCK